MVDGFDWILSAVVTFGPPHTGTMRFAKPERAAMPASAAICQTKVSEVRASAPPRVPF